MAAQRIVSRRQHGRPAAGRMNNYGNKRRQRRKRGKPSLDDFPWIAVINAIKPRLLPQFLTHKSATVNHISTLTGGYWDIKGRFESRRVN